MRYWKKLIFIGSTLSLLSGCQLLGAEYPHNDVLVFGTTTKLALDVSAPIQNGAIPEFTVGYKRNEGVWMPLKMNGFPIKDDRSEQGIIIANALNDCKQRLMKAPYGFQGASAEARCMAQLAPGLKYMGSATGINSSKGGFLGESDTYSVFASFGAKGGLSFNNGNGQLAQFFATGIAAQRLGANPQVGNALNTNAPNAVEAQANAEAAADDPASIAYEQRKKSSEPLVACFNDTDGKRKKLEAEPTIKRLISSTDTGETFAARLAGYDYSIQQQKALDICAAP